MAVGVRSSERRQCCCSSVHQTQLVVKGDLTGRMRNVDIADIRGSDRDGKFERRTECAEGFLLVYSLIELRFAKYKLVRRPLIPHVIVRIAELSGPVGIELSKVRYRRAMSEFA